MADIRCVIVGQSNTLLHFGYAAHLAQIDGVQASRFGAGSSSSLLAPLYVQPGFCSGMDFCIVDVAMFDQSIKQNRDGIYDCHGLRRYLRYVIHTARADGCCPILVAFGTAGFEQGGRWYWITEKVSDIIEIHREIAVETQCPLFDWWLFVALKQHADPRLTLRDLYSEVEGRPDEMDGSHPRSAYQAEIAQYLHRYMTRHLEKERPEIEVAADLSLFRTMVLADAADDCTRVVRSTSIMSHAFVSISEGRVVEIAVDDADILAGYTVNLNECAGLVRFSGDTVVTKDLRLPDTAKGRGLRYHIAPVFAECRPDRGRLTIEAVGADTPVTEQGVIRNSDLPLDGPAVIELGSLIFERRNCQLSYRTSHLVGEDRDIVAFYSKDGRLDALEQDQDDATALVSITAHIGMIGDVAGLAGSVGSEAIGENIQGFLIEAPTLDPASIRYRARQADRQWTDWSRLGHYVGTRGESKDLTGLSVRLEEPLAAAFDLTVVGTFRGDADKVVVLSGIDCVSPSDGTLSKVRLMLRRRASQPLPDDGSFAVPTGGEVETAAGAEELAVGLHHPTVRVDDAASFGLRPPAPTRSMPMSWIDRGRRTLVAAFKAIRERLR